MRKLILLLLVGGIANANPLHDIVTKGSTDRSVVVEIIDSTDGTPETGVVFNTSGIDLWYRREGAAVTSITEATLAALTTAHTDGGFLAIANGSYRLDLPDAAFATGANYVDFGGTVTGMVVIGGRVRLVDSNFEVANIPANVTQFGGSNGTFASGRPEVNATHIAGSSVSTSSAQIGVNVVNAAGTAWGSGAITAASIATDAIGAAEVASDVSTEFSAAVFTVNATQISGDSGAADTLEASLDGTAGSVAPFGSVDQGTAQSATGTTLVLRSALAIADDAANGMTLLACGSTQGYCQARAVTDYVSSTDTATVETWTVTPSGTITYYLFGTAPSTGGGSGLDAAGVRSAIGLASANLDTQLSTIDDFVDTEVAAIKTKTDFLPSATAGASGGVFIAGTNAATTVTTSLTTTFTGNVTGSVGSVSGAVGSVTGNVGGNVTGSVGSVATGGITAASIATDAIGAAEIASDAGTEIATAVAAVQGILTGTCDSGSTTTCVDDALTQADATQLEDRLMCFSDGWCGLITTFTPGSDQATFTKVAPSTRGSKTYTIFPSTLE